MGVRGLGLLGVWGIRDLVFFFGGGGGVRDLGFGIQGLRFWGVIDLGFGTSGFRVFGGLGNSGLGLFGLCSELGM